MRLRKEVTVTDCCHGHDHIPDRVGHAAEVLTAHIVELLLEQVQQVARNENAHKERNREQHERLLLHETAKRKGNVCIAAIHCTHPLSAWAHKIAQGKSKAH